ncbi:MAG: hypothetical protein QXE81_04195 [Desulfurococcaceae archaeon]
MRLLIEDIERRLDSLIDTLRSKNIDSSSIKVVSELKEKISLSRTPVMPTPSLWDKYASLIAMIEEASRIIQKPGNEYALHSLVITLREYINQFTSSLEKSYFIERAQLMLPSVLGLSFAIVKLYVDPGFNPIIAIIGLVTLILASINPLYGILATSILGGSYILIRYDTYSYFVGLLLVSISALTMYFLHMAKSKTFINKIRSAIEGINRIINTALSPSSVKIEEAVRDILEKNTYRVEELGIFRFLDRDELLKYKTAMLIATGLYQHRVIVNNISRA